MDYIPLLVFVVEFLINIDSIDILFGEIKGLFVHKKDTFMQILEPFIKENKIK